MVKITVQKKNHCSQQSSRQTLSNSSMRQIPLSARTSAPASSVHSCDTGLRWTYAVKPTADAPCPVVNTTRDAVFSTYLRNWDLAVPGSPQTSTFMSPRTLCLPPVTHCKQSWYVTSQPRQLSLLPSMGRYSEYQLLGWVIINGDGGCRLWQHVRLTFALSKYDHITPLLRQLHRLKVPWRIDYKLAIRVYKCLHGLAHKHWLGIIIIKRLTLR